MDCVTGKTIQADASVRYATYCQPCFYDGKTLPAEGYCNICKEFMCFTCTNVHKKLRITKSHTILDKSTMPTTMKGYLIEEESTEPCDIHPGECIKYYCPIHQSLNCGHCSIIDHQSCKQQIISDIAKAFKDGSGHKDIKEVLSQSLEYIDTCLSTCEDKNQFVEKLSESEISKLREYRDQVNKYFDEREKELLNIISQRKQLDRMVLNSITSKCDNLKTQVNELKANIEAQENNASQLFIKARKAESMLAGWQSALAEINMETTIHQYQFRKDPVTERLLASHTGLGTVEEVVDAKALDQRCEPTTSTATVKGMKDNNSPIAVINVQTVGDSKAAETTKRASPDSVTPLITDGTQTTAEPKLNQRCERTNSTAPDKGKNDITTSIAVTNVQTAGDIKAVQTTKRASPDTVTKEPPSISNETQATADSKQNQRCEPTTSTAPYKGKKDTTTPIVVINGQTVVDIKAAQTAKRASPDIVTTEPPLIPYGTQTTAEPKQKKQTSITTDLTSLKFTPAQDILVKSPSDSSECFLTSMLLLPGNRLLLSDRNGTVKLVDLNTSSIVSEVLVQNKAWDMCLLPGDRVAVSGVPGCIQFLETRKQISLGNNIKVDGDSLGIGYHTECLIVSYSTGKVEKMNLKGKVLKKVPNNRSHENLFEYPWYLTVVSKGHTAAIYVTDCGKHTITKLDMDLNISKTLQDPSMRAPRGITPVGNQLLICGSESNNIMCLALPCVKITQLMGVKEKIWGPRSICYSQQQNKLFVTCCTQWNADCDNYVRVYTAT
ncbi:uncharacterized protein LOC128237295 isoform X1 [Mya arenaria]|uniref:uncharacterized protein LOC128237295 isoform X1 n=1 Tax=Mya arenaria TaxID=6604 RepID=UPI0022E8D431|nr:uncharacterized protein LOC128237295 isoform X1 [Mya arenaria]XP_052808637.1 uncharacterized protein LOC128237295 isoform X1 [Mya arenaria]